MNFVAITSVDEMILNQRYLNCNDPDFKNQVRNFLNEAGIAVGHYFLLENLKSIRSSQKDWNEIDICKEIILSISFGDIYNLRTLTGTCDAKYEYAVKAEDPGIYEKNLMDMQYNIPPLLEESFRELFDFVDWGI